MRQILPWMIGVGALVAAVCALFWPVRADDARVDVAIVFLMDVSDSMTDEEVTFARSAHALAMNSEPMVDAIVDGAYGRVAVAYVEFSRLPELRIDWTLIDGPDAAATFAAEIMSLDMGMRRGGPDYSVGTTAVGAALLEASTVLGRLPFAADKLVVDVVGDGTSTDGPPVRLGREALLSRGVTINAMPLMRSPSDIFVDRWYAAEVIGGPTSFSMPVTSIDQLPQALRSKIVQELF